MPPNTSQNYGKLAVSALKNFHRHTMTWWQNGRPTETNRQRDRETEWQAGRQTDQQAGKQKNSTTAIATENQWQ